MQEINWLLMSRPAAAAELHTNITRHPAYTTALCITCRSSTVQATLMQRASVYCKPCHTVHCIVITSCSWIFRQIWFKYFIIPIAYSRTALYTHLQFMQQVIPVLNIINFVWNVVPKPKEIGRKRMRYQTEFKTRSWSYNCCTFQGVSVSGQYYRQCNDHTLLPVQVRWKSNDSVRM